MTAARSLVPVLAAPLLIGAGVASVVWPRASLALALAAALSIAGAVRGRLVLWDMVVVALAGALVLDYGFANVGIGGSVPIPLVELLLAALLLGMVVRPAAPRLGAPAVFAVLFIGLGAVRLAVDYPTWGRDALRDFTLPLEVSFLFVGYWALAVFGVERWIRALRWIFVVCLAYFALYPWREQLTELSPLVGLQQPVPLIGNFWGAGTAAAAGFFFFVVVRPLGRMSYLFAAGFLPLMALFQLRGLYLAFPAAVALLLLLLPARLGSLRVALAAAVALGSIALALLLPLAPTGRVGPLSPGLAVSQLRTLAGSSGPGAGTLEARKKWIETLRQRVSSEPYGWLVGIGLGPDLATGFRVDPNAPFVRKPHNDYLEIYGRLGALGGVFFVGLIATALIRIVQAARNGTGTPTRFLWWVVGSAAVYLLMAATQPVLAYPFGTVPLFMMLGAGLALVQRQQGGIHPENRRDITLA